MKKALTKLIYLGVVLIMCAGVLCACNKNDDDFRNPRNGEPEAGEFYTLQEAYDNGWLSKNQLESIAYYYAEFEHNTNKYGNYNPISKNPEVLSDKIENSIKQKYLFELNQIMSDVDISGIHITKYYGTYDDLVAVTIINDYISADLIIAEEYELGEVKFYHYDYQIKVYAI